MSDHDPAPDPLDKAYVEAEAVLNDERQRAARRARVLAAVASEGAPGPLPASAPVPAPVPARRPAWARGGWLVAASVAGISALVAVQIYQPPVQEPPPAPRPTIAAAEGPAVETLTPPAAAPTAVPKAAPAPAAVAPPAAAKASGQVPAADTASPLPPPPALELPRPSAAFAPPPPAPPPPPAQAAADEVMVTGSRLGATPAAPSAARIESRARAEPAVQGARLRAAAAAGRTGEITSLLADGTPIDAAEEDGETALMKAVQARRPAAAALLRRQGASLDRENRAGISAREMAASIDDPELNRALGLGR